MQKNIKAKDFQGGTGVFTLRSYPDECPVCHRSIYPVFIEAVYGPKDSIPLQVVFRCTVNKCSRLFIAAYEKMGDGICELLKTEPVYPIKQTFSEEIRKISPTFQKIYNQSMAAESHNLDQLTGIGLRKALEFLIKDFSINQNPSQVEDIKKTPLSVCIKSFIDDQKIKTCAELATWLGNDETHYIRKWEDKDINDLKLLIKLTVNWIENFLLTEKYTQEMKPKDEDTDSA